MSYIGNKEIEKIEGSVVYYKQGEGVKPPFVETFSEDVLKDIITEEPLDATGLRDKKCFPIVGKILDLLLKENVYISEVEYILQRLKQSINVNMDAADEKNWGVPTHLVTMKQLDDLLKK